MKTHQPKPGKEKKAEEASKLLPIVQWLRDTAGPKIGLDALHQRLAGKLSGTIVQTIREERNDRI